MCKFHLIIVLCALTGSVNAGRRVIASLQEYSAEKLVIPYPLKLTTLEVAEKETRRLIHFLKRAFVGLSATYTTGLSDSNYGPVVGIQFPSRVGLRIWGGMSQSRTMDMKRDYDLDSKMSGVNGRRIGIGMKLAGDLRVDLQYQTIDGDQSVRNHLTILSISVPINL